MDELLSEKPYGVDYGTLQNGLRYYVRSNSKPKMRAALALAVNAGYIYTLSVTLVCLLVYDIILLNCFLN